MAAIKIVTVIDAPIEMCFDLARDIDFHVRSMARTGERVVAGRTTGLIRLGESVTWKARHLGVVQRLTSRITAFDRPAYFRDEMTAGAFQSFAHDHRFEVQDGRTVMTDLLVFRSPFGALGRFVDAFFMVRYLRRLLEDRCRAIKQEAEAVVRNARSVGSADTSAQERRGTRGEDRRRFARVIARWSHYCEGWAGSPSWPRGRSWPLASDQS